MAENEAKLEQTGLYRAASIAVDNWLDLHMGERFDLDTICRQLEIRDAAKRNLITIKLAYEVKRGKLEKDTSRARVYRTIDNTIDTIDVVNSNKDNVLSVRFPQDAEGSDFNLHYSRLFPKSIILLAGEKGKGKTTFCLNFIAENMDKYLCIYHTNEMSGEELRDRLDNFPDVNWYKESGNLKFIAIERYENYQDVVLQYPDAIHVIDYIDPGEKAYMIGSIIDKIRRNLNTMALIAIQKKQSTGTKKDGTLYHNYVDYGTGGQYSEHKARIVIHLQGGNQLYVKSCKAWREKCPSGRLYAYKITDHGSRFSDIREIVRDEDLPLPPQPKETAWTNPGRQQRWDERYSQ